MCVTFLRRCHFIHWLNSIMSIRFFFSFFFFGRFIISYIITCFCLRISCISGFFFIFYIICSNFLVLLNCFYLFVSGTFFLIVTKRSNFEIIKMSGIFTTNFLFYLLFIRISLVHFII